MCVSGDQCHCADGRRPVEWLEATYEEVLQVMEPGVYGLLQRGFAYSLSALFREVLYEYPSEK